MKPAQVALNLGTPPETPRTSSEIEEVSHPSSHWSAAHHDGELPLHYMSTDDKARRRVRLGGGALNGNSVEAHELEPLYDDEGKDVYNKMNAMRGASFGGRPRRPVHPPPSSIVSNVGL